MTNTTAGGGAVKSGYYLDANRWHLEPVASDGGTLPPGRWVRIPTAAALALVPVLGGLFLVFLPFIGIVLTLRAIAGEMVKALHGPAAELAATVTPGWQPGEAHFTGMRPERAGAEEKAPAARGEALEALAREIAARRANG
jgi:hypothetical protein